MSAVLAVVLAALVHTAFPGVLPGNLKNSYKCGADGIYPDTSSCGDYYYCVNSVAFHLACPTGMLFNADLNTCQIASQVSCSQTSTAAPTTSSAAPISTVQIEFQCPPVIGVNLYPYDADCTKFLLCVGSVAYLAPCPTGLYFNGQTSNCDVSSANCPTSTAATTTTPAPTTITTSAPTTITPAPTTPTVQTTTAAFTCPAGVTSGLFPNPFDCASFYVCAGTVVYSMPCPSGLTFNADTSRCDSSFNPRCGSTSAAATQSTSGSTSAAATQSSVTQSTRTAPTVGGGVPGGQGCTSANDTHIFADTSNCYYFYQCVGFSPYRRPCPTGLQFNAATGKCDYSYNANCDFGGVPPATLPNPTGFACPPGQIDAYYPDVLNCSAFYHCVQEVAYHRPCEEDLFFNPAINVCDFPINVDCAAAAPTPAPAFRCSGGTDKSVHADTTNCYYFYQCVGFNAYRMPCPAGLQFNVARGRCDYPGNAACTFVGAPPATLPSPSDYACPDLTHSYFADSANCSAFYECIQGVAYHLPCGRGLFFNPAINVCDFPINVDCAAAPPTPAPAFRCSGGNDTTVHADTTNCYFFYQCVGFNSFRQQCPTGLQFNEATSRCDYPYNANCVYGGSPVPAGPSGSFPCPAGTVHAYFADATNCSAFWQCTDSVSRHKYCKNGLYFNPLISVCDFPENVNCPTAPVLTSGFQCSDGVDTSLHADTSNCYFYYQCVGLKAYHMQCPSGLQFAVSRNRCDYPSVAQCTFGGSPVPAGPTGGFPCPAGSVHAYFQDVSNCTNFYECSDSIAYHKSCRFGLYFNPLKNVCDFPSNVACSGGVPVPPAFTCPAGDNGPFADTDNCAYFYSCFGGIPYHQPCSPGLYFNADSRRCDYPYNVTCSSAATNIPPVVAPFFSCALTPDLYPDTADCNYFYQCTGGVAYHMACPPTLHFNAVNKTCDFAYNANCTYGGAIVTLRPPSGFNCPSGPDGYYADSANCSNFWQCTNGIAYRKTCKYGLYFNAVVNACDYPANVNCGVRSSGGVQVGSSVCPGGNQTGPFPDTTDCNFFYLCSGITAYRVPCPTGLQFNVGTSQCDFPANANCPFGGAVPSIIPPLVGFTCPAGVVHAFYPDTTNCSAFYECVNGAAYHLPCETDLFFNPATSVCDYAINVVCAAAPPTPAPAYRCSGGNDTTVHPDTSNCYFFYQCVGFHLYHQQCPTGLQFNEATSRCDYPANANCVYGGSPVPVGTSAPGFVCPAGTVQGYFPDVTNCTNFYQCTDSVAYHKSCGFGLYFNSANNVCDFPDNVVCSSSPVIVSSFNCPAGDNGPFADSLNCGSFYLCVGDKAYHMPCAPGLYFNPDTKRCDFAFNVTCASTATEIPLISSPFYACELPQGLFPDTADCNFFYQCTGNVAYRMACPPGLQFSVATKTCDYPYKANCTYGGALVTIVPPTGFSCPVGVPDGYYADASNCSNFWHCSNSIAYHQMCRRGLYFNPITTACDYAYKVNCPSAPVTLPGGFTCPSTANALYADSQNCGYFYACTAGVAFHMPCPAGLQFNTATSQCDFPANVVCTAPTPVQPTPNANGFACPAYPTNPSNLYPDPTDCQHFYQCINGVARRKKCRNGTNFNRFIQVCGFVEDVLCS